MCSRRRKVYNCNRFWITPNGFLSCNINLAWLSKRIYIESVEYTSGYINFFYYKLKRWGRISLYLDCGRQSTRWKIHEFLSDYANAFFCVNKRSRNKVSKIKFWWVAKHKYALSLFLLSLQYILTSIALSNDGKQNIIPRRITLKSKTEMLSRIKGNEKE